MMITLLVITLVIKLLSQKNTFSMYYLFCLGFKVSFFIHKMLVPYHHLFFSSGCEQKEVFRLLLFSDVLTLVTHIVVSINNHFVYILLSLFKSSMLISCSCHYFQNILRCNCSYIINNREAMFISFDSI